jgi:DNA-binding MarR family transcriptional regulator
MPESYYRFLSLAKAIQGLPVLPLLDPIEERLLNALAALWADGGKVTVLQAMKCAPGASPSTVQRRLRSLEEKGLVTYGDKPGDQRAKRVQPTPLAMEYFAALSGCMDEAIRRT